MNVFLFLYIKLSLLVYLEILVVIILHIVQQRIHLERLSTTEQHFIFTIKSYIKFGFGGSD